MGHVLVVEGIRDIFTSWLVFSERDSNLNARHDKTDRAADAPEHY